MAPPRTPNEQPWVKTAHKGVLIATTVVGFLMVALGLVAIGIFFVFIVAMNDFGSNK